jgi:hypothetical protein
MPSLFLTVTASTKRSPDVASGRVGAAVEYLTYLSCTPFYPVDAELMQRIPRLAGRQELLSVFVDASADVVEGDLLVIAGTEYPIRAVEDWTWPPTALVFRLLVVEELK